jgi:glycosyltransferase involved in cell wall biosynthesis
MRICKIWDADYPWDVRVEKVADSLIAAGHEVHLVCRNLARRERCESNGNLTIHRLPVVSEMFSPIHGLWNFPYPVNPVWIHSMDRVIREAQVDLILVRDLLLALPAAILAKIHRIPVILDMAENYPAMLQDRLRYTPSGLLGRLVRHPSPIRLVERLSLALVDHIIVVVEESRERLVGAGVPSDRITIVCNTPRLEGWQAAASRQNCPRSKQDIHLAYLGNLDGSRGLDVAIRAVHRLKDAGRFVKLSIMGNGPSREQLTALATHSGVADRVEITGRLPFSQVTEVMAQADIGLIPHYATAAWNSTIPNKLFDYMALGLPVIVSDTKPTARIVRKEQCGEVFRDRNEADLARCIVALADPKARRTQGENGRAAIARLYNWNYDSQILVRTLEAVRASVQTNWS